MRRVVITGLGMLTPLGSSVEVTWKNLLEGRSGASKVEIFDVSELPCRIACFIPRGDGSDGTFCPDKWLAPKEQRRVQDFVLFGLAASGQALKDAGWMPKSYEEQVRTGVLIGSATGGWKGLSNVVESFLDGGCNLRRLSPFSVPGNLINTASGYVSIKYGLKGPNHSVVTACSTGSHAIGDAFRMIALGDADVMIAGGVESSICPIGLAGFCACRALSTHFNDEPRRASRPWDVSRDGFVMGEGAGTVILEELENAKARGARIYAEVIGYGMSGDAHHITAPPEDGDGAYRCMRAALRNAGVDISDIDYINAHGTSTVLGDLSELRAVGRLFGSDRNQSLRMSSTKSATGHLLGAAGAVEAIFSVLAIRDNITPPTLNLDKPCMETGIDLVPHESKSGKVDIVLSNSFGFGGTNASLVLKRFEI
ncbi:MAG: beta-ketoacyl-ACP synthase II [Alphaproteobacteria bacterium]|nr:beta-ketoacyl-ACP synthase II [Alphaproteobacteria bacterium]